METETQVTRCTCEDIGLDITGTDADEAKRLINACLEPFASPLCREDGGGILGSFICRNCGATLDGLIGSFRWGMIHGEGRCSCGWPCRAYHVPKYDDGEAIFNGPIQRILQYHPDDVEKREQKQEGE